MVDTSFVSLIDSPIGVFGTFGILAGVCLSSGILVLLALPETKGRTLYEVRRPCSCEVISCVRRAGHMPL